MKKFIPGIIGILLFAGAALSQAQDVEIKAYVSKNKIAADEQFEYTIEISGRTTSLPRPSFPEMAAFYVLSGPNTSTSIQLINGAMSSTVTYSFYLSPKNEGELTIGKALLTYKGSTYSSNEVVVSVSKSNQAPPPTQGGAKQKSSSDADIAGESLYLKTEVSKRNVYVGDQIVVEYRLYFRVNVRGYNIDKLPANTGFWSEDFKMPAQPVISTEVVNGQNYNVAVIRKVALFPTQSGELTIEPMQVTLEALVREQRGRRSLFDSFFDDPFGRTVQKTVVSKSLKINVRPLPETNKPAGFTGAVGNFKFDVSVDKTEARANDAIALKMKLSGAGNIKLAELPAIQSPPDIEQYPPKVSTQVNNDGQLISGTKTAEYILIPRLEGQYQIKPITFSFFEPGASAYRSITTPAIALNILKGAGSGLTVNQPGIGLSRQEVTLLGQDIRFIKESSEFSRSGFKPYLSFPFWSAISTALLLFIGFFFYNEHQARLLGNERLARSLKAGKIAAKQLAQAKGKLSAANQNEFYKAVSAALQGFVQDKLNIELTDFSTANVRRVLSEKGIGEEEISEYIAVLQESDFRQFAASASSADQRHELFERAKVILTKLEKWI